MSKPKTKGSGTELKLQGLSLMLDDRTSRLSHSFELKPATLRQKELTRQINDGSVGEYAELCTRFAQVAERYAPVTPYPAHLRRRIQRQSTSLGRLTSAINKTQDERQAHPQFMKVIDAQLATLDAIGALTERIGADTALKASRRGARR